MANNLIQIKRTSVSGRVANTSTLPNAGELAINMTDGIMYSTNGSVVFEIGANNTNVNVSGNLTVKSIVANGSIGTSGQVLKSNGSATYWGTDNADVGANNQILYRNSSNVLTTSSGLVYDGVSIKVNGNLESLYQNGDEGGEIFLAKPVNTSISGTGITLDIYQNKLRIFENGGNNRGAYIDFTAAANGVGTNLLTGGTGGTGTVTSVDSGNGLTGGPITNSGTLSVLANNGITANSTGVFVNQGYNYTWTATQTFQANIAFTGNNISIVSNTGSVMFAGSGDTNWRIGRSTGAFTKFYYTNNSLDFIAANSNLEGIAFGFTGDSVYLETGYAGTFTKNPIYVGNSTVNVSINSTSFTGTANNASYLGGTIAAAFVANGSGGLVQNSTGTFIKANNGISVNSTGVFVVAGSGHSAVNATGIHVGAGNGIAVNSTAVAVNANNGVSANSTGLFVTQGTGTVVNSTGVHVNSSYIGTLAANSATYLGGNTASDLRSYSDTISGTAYSNAIVFASNASNVNTGTLAEARLPYRMDQNVRTSDSVQFGNMVLTGNLTVNGGVVTLTGNSVTFTDNMIYLNQGVSANITNVTANGTYIIFTANNNYQAGWDVTVTGVDPSGYNGTYLNIFAANSTTFTVANTTTGAYVSGGVARGKTDSNPDIGITAGYNDGTYHHTGIFRDATDGIWKVFDGYDPEPDESPFIDTANTSFRIADFQANVVTVASLNSAGLVNTATLNVSTTANLAAQYSNTTGFYPTSNTVGQALGSTTARWAITGSTGTFSSTFSVGGAVGLTATTQNINAVSQTTGTINLGGASQTGAINIGRSTANQTLSLANGVTASGSIKTIEIGTLGAAGSNTVITVGSTTGDGLTTIQTPCTSITGVTTFGANVSGSGNSYLDGFIIDCGVYT